MMLVAWSLLVSPAFPQVRLWPDAIESAGLNPESLPRISDRFNKRYRLLEERFQQIPLPLAGIYQLMATEHDLRIEKLAPQEALMALMQNIYVARFGDVLLKPSDTIMLKMSAEIVRKAPLMRLSRPSSLTMLELGAKLVEEQVSGVGLEDVDHVTTAESEVVSAAL